MVTFLRVVLFAFALFAPVRAALAAEYNNLVGIQLGMTPEQGMAAAKVWAPKDQWTSDSIQLTWRDDLSRDIPIPNTTMPSVLHNKRTSPTNAATAYFTTVPGRQQVAIISRMQMYLKEKPQSSDILAALIKKFGKPFPIEYQGNVWLWSFNADGRPFAPTINPNGEPCVSTHLSPYNPVSKPYVMPGKQKASTAYLATCGAIVVTAKIVESPKTFVYSLDVDMIGHQVATAGFQEASRIADAAKSMALKQAKEAGKKLANPDL